MEINKTYQLIPTTPNRTEEFTLSLCTKIGDIDDFAFYIDKIVPFLLTIKRTKIVDGIKFFVVRAIHGDKENDYLFNEGLVEHYKQFYNIVLVENY